jgi:predicted ArsR family transcriptional regulator
MNGRTQKKVLMLLSQGLTVEEITKELSISEEALADAIINLEEKGFVKFEQKNWILTEKGQGMLEDKKEELKRLKIEHIRGDIGKETYNKQKEGLKRMQPQETSEAERFAPVETAPVKEAVVYCPKCGTENKAGYKYCRKCGDKLKER